MEAISQAKEIISENPIKQIWKLLHYFHDEDYAVDAIRRNHTIKAGEQERNIRKQARQISYCLKQAEEYFRATEIVSLSTKPVLLYYGIVNLSQVLVLLKQNGSYSLDAQRRKEKKYANHGLDLQKSISAIKEKGTIESFLSEIKCSLVKNGSGKPVGQFSSFYESLVSPSVLVNQELHDDGKSTYIKRIIVYPTVDVLKIEKLPENFLVSNLIKGLPELQSDLLDTKITPNITRGNIRSTVTRFYKKDETGQEKIDKISETVDFFIDGIPTQVVGNKMIDFYSKKNPNLKVVANFGANLHIQLNKTITQSNKSEYYPDLLDSIDGNKFYICDPESYIIEPAAYFIVAYCFGMLSRYYPDIWIKSIRQRASLAELVDTFFSSAYRKFPNLILDQMTSTKHFVHL